MPADLSDAAFDAALRKGYAKALRDAPPWVRAAWDDYMAQPRAHRECVPFLYHLIDRGAGKGTPPEKMPKDLALYRDPSPVRGHACGSCPFAYSKVVKPGRIICSQLRGPVTLDAWCVLPHLQGVWPKLDPAFLRRLRGGSRA